MLLRSTFVIVLPLPPTMAERLAVVIVFVQPPPKKLEAEFVWTVWNFPPVIAV
jgi:hypothetical protein